MSDELKEERRTAARDILAGRLYDGDSSDADQKSVTETQIREEVKMQEMEPSLEEKLLEFNQQHGEGDQNASSSYESESSYESDPDRYFLDDSALISGEEEERSVPDANLVPPKGKRL